MSGACSSSVLPVSNLSHRDECRGLSILHGDETRGASDDTQPSLASLLLIRGTWYRHTCVAVLSGILAVAVLLYNR